MKKDIEKAFLAEQKYILNKNSNKEQSLLNLLEQYGYNTLEEYFQDKKIYQIHKLRMMVYYSDVDNCLQILFDLVKKAEPSILIVPSDKIFVYHGSEHYDNEYCQKKKIPVYEVGHQGGNIVGGPKDISIGLIIPKEIDIDLDWILEGFQKIFRENGEKVTINKNDLMLNGRKIMGSAILNFDQVLLFVANFSFSDVSEEIEKICNVPREKEPGYISTFSRTSLEEGVLKWLLP